MAAHGRPALRELFDDSPTPHIAHPPRTHHRDYYLATDGSFREMGGGLGVVAETRTGDRVLRLSLPDAAPDNNVAEYRALHLGLDVLAARVPRGSSVGVLIDHDDLAANVNATVLADGSRTRDPFPDVTLPPATAHHWRGIRARIAGFGGFRAARIDSDVNPAHPLANDPDSYAHVNEESDRSVRSGPDPLADGEQIPPPSRADRHAGN
ncbi:hypothetical protein L593_08160 [Salinarchaeum sp. Harcht-Bsk1]|uniref:hypothetical protein n=1 Tax=Salinarchaeum sp. Harcht-Bsk1 TaxID=1333523 RepID=UPI0003423CDF|nr:hypothetical protein [Salinarchaeum sp. Harcht-Bsk1]AGN01577.1 hypothetical protein L593_08160 [Salinarchaeum sp. Harcht-Bsk1]